MINSTIIVKVVKTIIASPKSVHLSDPNVQQPGREPRKLRRRSKGLRSWLHILIVRAIIARTVPLPLLGTAFHRS